MIVFLLLVVVLLTGFTIAAVMGRIGGFMAEPTSSLAFGGLPAGALSTDDIALLRFDQALRGYRMEQVDEVLDALRARLGELEDEVASLSAAVPSRGAGSEPQNTEQRTEQNTEQRERSTEQNREQEP